MNLVAHPHAAGLVGKALDLGHQHLHQVKAIGVEELAVSCSGKADQPVAEFDEAAQQQSVEEGAIQLQHDTGAVQGAAKGGGRVHSSKRATEPAGAATGKAGVDRRRRLGKIHQGKKALGLAESEYRALLVRASADEHGLGGFDSSANMTEAQHIAVLSEMARLGFKAADIAAKKRFFPGRPKGDLSPMLKKVEALLAEAKRPWSYAHALSKKMHRVDKVEWLNPDQLHRLLAALQSDANRRAGRG